MSSCRRLGDRRISATRANPARHALLPDSSSPLPPACSNTSHVTALYRTHHRPSLPPHGPLAPYPAAALGPLLPIAPQNRPHRHHHPPLHTPLRPRPHRHAQHLGTRLARRRHHRRLDDDPEKRDLPSHP